MSLRERLLHFLFQDVFDAVQRHGLLKDAVREGGNACGLSTDSYEAFDILVPGCDVFVSDGPVKTQSVLQIGFEVVITPAETHAAPEEGSSTKYICPDPVVALDFVVGILQVVHIEVFVFLFDRKVSGLNFMNVLFFRCQGAAVRKLPRGLCCRMISRDMLKVTSSFEENGFQPLFAEFLSGPAAGNSRSNNDGVERKSFLPHFTFEFAFWLTDDQGSGSVFGSMSSLILFNYQRFPFFSSLTAWSTALAVSAI